MNLPVWPMVVVMLATSLLGTIARGEHHVSKALHQTDDAVSRSNHKWIHQIKAAPRFPRGAKVNRLHGPITIWSLPSSKLKPSDHPGQPTEMAVESDATSIVPGQGTISGTPDGSNSLSDGSAVSPLVRASRSVTRQNENNEDPSSAQIPDHQLLGKDNPSFDAQVLVFALFGLTLLAYWMLKTTPWRTQSTDAGKNAS